MNKCAYCGKDTENPKYCSRRCSAIVGNSTQTRTEEQKRKTSESLKQYYANNPSKCKSEEHSKKVGATTKKKFREEAPETILSLSSRTVGKILQRLGVGCSRCGWKEAACDIHHIEGRKIENPDHHSNLTILCPNCHRLCHAGKVKREEIKSLEEHLGDDWKEFYYG